MRKSTKYSLIRSTLMFLALIIGLMIGFSIKKTKEVKVEVPVFIEKIVEVEKETEQVEDATVEEYEHFDVIATAYCPCVKCCGKSDGITATGVKAKEGRTIAADPDVLPYGTEIIIGGNTYIVEDCGSMIKQNKIDVFFDSHQEALQWGVQKLTVLVKRCEK